jgi:hypothetical protein
MGSVSVLTILQFEMMTDINPATSPICFLKVYLSIVYDIVLSLMVFAPTATVRGVDLFPPPITWIPPNCFFEIDDILQSWSWRDPFDLIHLRLLDIAFTPEETDHLYKQCYE